MNKHLWDIVLAGYDVTITQCRGRIGIGLGRGDHFESEFLDTEMLRSCYSIEQRNSFLDEPLDQLVMRVERSMATHPHENHVAFRTENAEEIRKFLEEDV